MSTHEIQTTNSVLGSLMSLLFWALSLSDMSEIIKIVAGIFAIVASAVTIYYTIKNNRKK